MNICRYCGGEFTRSDNLARHTTLCLASNPVKKRKIKMFWKTLAKKDEVIASQDNTIKQLVNIVRGVAEDVKDLKKDAQLSKQLVVDMKKIAEDVDDLKKNPSVINNNLQIICVTGKDNYLQKITDIMGDEYAALKYIVNCAIGGIDGDCKLIEKNYAKGAPLPGSSSEVVIVPSITVSKSKSEVVYYDENKNKVTTSIVSFAYTIAENLMTCYLKTLAQLTNGTLNNRQCPNKFMEEYNLQLMQEHVYELIKPINKRKVIDKLDLKW